MPIYGAVQDEKLFRAKISDFGLSAHMTAGQTQVNISQGTEAYLPKEVFQNLAVTEASDIYAMGLLMWEIFYGIFWFIVWDTEKRRKKYAPVHDPGSEPNRTVTVEHADGMPALVCMTVYHGCEMRVSLHVEQSHRVCTAAMYCLMLREGARGHVT